MKKIYFALLTISFFMNTYAQEKRISFELNYPFPIGNNFIGKNYSGIIDAGCKYRFINTDLMRAGASLNGGILKYKNDTAPQNFTMTNYVVQPRLFAEFNFVKIPKFHPSLGLGYSFMIFNANGTSNGFDISNYNDTQGGFNINTGILYDLNDRFFVQMQYDFVKLSVKSGIPDTAYNSNVNLLKMGVGIRI